MITIYRSLSTNWLPKEGEISAQLLNFPKISIYEIFPTKFLRRCSFENESTQSFRIKNLKILFLRGKTILFC